MSSSVNLGNLLKMPPQYCVVVFEETDEVDIVSSKWLCKNSKYSHWPAVKGSNRIRKATLEHEEPNSTWSVHPIRILKTIGE